MTRIEQFGADPSAPGDAQRLRIDGSHPIATDGLEGLALASAAVSAPAAMAMASVMDSTEPINVQATQLARHLQERRREVDHRETLLNARIAQLENDLRTSRMWVRERSEEFSRRERELAEQIAQQESRIRGLTTSEIAWDDARQEHTRALQVKEEELQRREARLDQLQQELVEQQKSFHSRHRRLDEQERSLDEQWRQLHEQRVDWQQQTNETLAELDKERQACAAQRAQGENYDRSQRQAWEARQQQCDERQVALEQIREDILRFHRESLEMRLVAEQLWSELSAKTPVGELIPAVVELRAQLADQYRFAQQEVAARRELLDGLLARLDGRRTELASLRDELIGWVDRRQQELARQASELADREQQCERQRLQMRHAKQEWQAERQDLQRQIRQLTLQQSAQPDTLDLPIE